MKSIKFRAQSKHDMTPSSNNENSPTPNNKVAKLLLKYDLEEQFGSKLEQLWTAERDERKSLRELADIFNKRILKTTMKQAGMFPLEGEINNIYRLLTADDVSSGSRTEARKRLEQNGIDVEQLEKDFVSYQAIRSYLKEVRGAEYESDSDESQVDSILETIQRIQSRQKSVIKNSLRQLRKSSKISLGDFRLFMRVEVLCEDCNSQYQVTDLLKRGGCDCELD